MNLQLRESNLDSASGYQSPEDDQSSSVGQDFINGAWNFLDTALGISDTINSAKILFDPNSSFLDKLGATGDILLNVTTDAMMVTGVGEIAKGGYLAVKGGLYLAETAATKEAGIEAEITKLSSPPDPYASYGENGNLEGNIYDGAASSRAIEGTGNITRNIFDLDASKTMKASELRADAKSQGWTKTQTANGPEKWVDENGVARVTIKGGSDRAPGSADPHVEIKDATGQRIDPFGNPVTRKSEGNHTPIILD